MTSNLGGFWKEQEPKVVVTKFKKRKKKKKKTIVTGDLYKSQEWRSIRYKVLRNNDGCCMLCGRSKALHGVVLHVDHIIPYSKRPDLALRYDNLQVLCEDCNLGKSNKDCTDWRPPSYEIALVYEALQRQ